MQEIRLWDIRRQEAYELDQRLNYCATIALREAINDNIDYVDGNNLNDESIMVLARCYTDSLFASKDKDHHKHVVERLKIELNRHSPSSNPSRLELLVPIMAYALIISNEYNNDAVKTRIREDKKRAPYSGNGEYLYNRWKHVKPYEVKRSKKPTKSDTFDRKLAALKDVIVSSNAYYYCSSYDISLIHVLLKNYENVVKCQDIGRIALFLRRILTEGSHKDYPMNDLIRLYLANHLDNILMQSYALCDNDYACALQGGDSSNNLLMHFYDSFHHDKDGYIAESDYFPQDEQHAPLNLGFEKEYDGLSFAEIYSELSEKYTISHDDLNLLLYFYMDGYCLYRYATIVEDTKTLADDIIWCIKNRVDFRRSSLTNEKTNFALWRLNLHKSFIIQGINHNITGSLKGKRIDRYLCVPQIRGPIDPKYGQLSLF